MAKCELLEDDGSPADIKSGDVITTNGGMLGLGHAGIIEVRGDTIVVIEVMAAPDGSVHVRERDICDFMDDYDSQNREVFISRPKKPADTADADWGNKLREVVTYMKSKICNSYPVWMFAMDALFHLPEVWYCSDLVMEAFRRQGIELKISLNLWDASDDASTRNFMFLQRGEAIRQFGEVHGLRYLRGFELPESFLGNLKGSVDVNSNVSSAVRGIKLNEKGRSAKTPGECGCDSNDFHRMVSEQLWKKEVNRLSELFNIEIKRAKELILKKIS